MSNAPKEPTAVVGGAPCGIGLEIARGLAADHRVVLRARDEQTATQAPATLGPLAERAHPMALRVTA
jgi:short-subunit dehydrogenase